MAAVGRYAKMTAKAGQGEVMARKMLTVADDLREVPGCELYVINRAGDDPDVVWITELWRSQEQLDAALDRPSAADAIQISPARAGRIRSADRAPSPPASSVTHR